MKHSANLPILKGRFISFEGGEGSGKSSLLSSLNTLLDQKNIQAFFTYEPGGCELGKELRALLVKERAFFSPKAEALLYAAARAQHVEEVILPKLTEGVHVLSDRFVDASFAYQGVARGLGLKRVRDINEWAIAGLYPHRTYYLDVDPRVGLKRARQRQALDRIESEKIEFHQRIREAYQLFAELSPQRFVVVDAAQSAENVFRQVSTDLLAYLATA